MIGLGLGFQYYMSRIAKLRANLQAANLIDTKKTMYVFKDSVVFIYLFQVQ